MSVQGISFYDFLGKFIPGALLLLLFKDYTPTVELESLEVVIWIAAAYLIGIIWDKFIRWATSCLRRNPCMLKCSLENYKIYIEKLTGEIYNTCYKEDDKQDNSEVDKEDNIEKCSEDILCKYDDEYSLLMFHNMLGTVPKQESHENFLRNIWGIIVCYFVKVVLSCSCGNTDRCLCACNTTLIICLVALIIIVPIVWYKTQMSIYFTVWDNAYWTRYHISKEEEINNNTDTK